MYESIKYFYNILNDNKSGSATITEKIISTFKSLFKENEILSKAEVFSIIKVIFQKFPNFSILFHFLNQLSLYIESEGELINQEKLIKFVSDYENKWKNSSRKSAIIFLDKININNKGILLHSNSSAIKIVFEIAANKGIKPVIWQTVSSPANEGIIQAEKIASLGFKVNLIHEDEIWLFKDNFDFILLGSDFITDNFFINKTGSYSITLLNKPVYIIAETRKIITEKNIDKRLFDILTTEKEKNPKELYTGNVKNIYPENYYFEKIPYKNVKGICLETGIFTPESIFKSKIFNNFKFSIFFNNYY